jgi:diguanylate cyclase (GGDEF)-like protein/PAS domain S-box-containing protein
MEILAAVTSNVSLNAARTIASTADHNISNLITLQVVLGIAGLLASLILGWGLIHATRRQTAHFRSLVTASTDLVAAFGAGGCSYVSASVTEMLGRREAEVLGPGFARFVHEGDRAALEEACANGDEHELKFRLQNRFGEWRQLEAHVSDLRADRHIRGIVLNARDVTERVRLEQELMHQAFHDGLTGLANRALFRDRLDQSLSRSARTSESLAVLFVDLDGFKQVNDTLGHDAGDQLLEEVSRRFTTAIRPSDTLARLGGDEFALLLEEADEPLAVTVAERLLEKLSKEVVLAGREMSLGASVGVVVHGGGTGKSEELMRHADLAMYAAKKGGRGRFAVFHHEMGREMGDLFGIEHELRLGLQRGEINVHYQPQISLESREIVGVEALLRWRSPTRGPVPPGQFIPIAESTGLIDPLGEFVLREACEQTARWAQDGLLPESFVVWVNVSAKQLTAGGVGKLVRSALAEARIQPCQLGLEVTETAIVSEGTAGDRAMLELQELHDLGVRIAIDDFGTGFSSLAQLRRFPVDMIKVDRSFVQGIEHDPRDEAITTHTVNLAHAIGVLALAEGVESTGQLASIDELGCDLAQGYLFAHPTPADAVTQQLAAQQRTKTTTAA